jgi:cell division protease FtsH
MSEAEKELLAYHEAGHAVVAQALGLTAGVHKISIVARGRNLGHTAVFSDADKLIRTEQELRAELATTMAGVAAELVRFGNSSTGGEGDLRRATDLAREMVCSFGLSERVGRIAVGTKAGEVFLGRDVTSLGSLSEALLDRVDQEVARFVREAEGQATELLRLHRDALDTLAGRLVTEETLSGDELEAVLNVVASTAPRGRKARTARLTTTSTPSPRPA